MEYNSTSATNFQQSGDEKINYLPALAALSVVYFMMGLITCLNDTLIPFFKMGFSLSYKESSLVQFYFFLTYGIMSIPAGKLVEKLGYKKGMVAGFVIAALGAFLFFPAAIYNTYNVFLLALFILAIGIVILQVAANPYITLLGSPETASSRFNLIQGFGSMGTTIAPIIGSYFILSKIEPVVSSSDAVIFPYLIIGIVLVIIAIMLALLPLPIINSKLGKNISPYDKMDIKRKSVFSYSNLIYGIPAIFMYVGAEVSIGSFLTNYTSETLSIEAGSANKYVAIYWGSMLFGRLFGALLLKFINTATLLSICAMCAIVCIVVSISSTGYLAIWTMVLVGLFNSIMFASIFSLALKGLGKHTAQASGLLSTAIVGGAVITFSIGAMKDNFSWQLTFLLPILCYLYIIFYAMKEYKHSCGNIQDR